MTKLTRVANTIIGNEKALGLVELNEQSPKNRGFHRYQILYVVRDGQTAEWRKDLGLAKNFKGVNQLNIPGLLEHTCDELMALADELRGTSKIDVKDFLSLDRYKPA